MNANSISVHNLRKRFPGFLLDDISFQVWKHRRCI